MHIPDSDSKYANSRIAKTALKKRIPVKVGKKEAKAVIRRIEGEENHNSISMNVFGKISGFYAKDVR